MAEYIGDIEIPEITPSGTFPIVPDFGYGMAREPLVVVHRFGSANSKIEQRFYLGQSARRFIVQRAYLNETDREALRDFWESHYGPYGAFTYNAPNDSGYGTTAYTVRFANEPLSWEMIADEVSSLGVILIEIPTTDPSYSITGTLTRFPSSALETALLSQVQEIIPLIKIQPLESGYSTIYLSDRRATVGGNLYQPRLLSFQGISQGIAGESDQAEFIFGNADRVMRDLANDVDLYRASLEFSLYHVGTQLKLDLWKGEVVDWTVDSGPQFALTAADGIYELRLPYPLRRISRTCWKQYNDGNGCPYATQGSMDYTHFPSASPASCDKGYWSSNGCMAHGMGRYFGGILAEPQSLRVKDNSTGVWGFGRSEYTSTGIVNESIYDQVVPEIFTDDETWLDQDGNENAGMPVKCRVALGREEGDFYSGLGVVGEGPMEFATEDVIVTTLTWGPIKLKRLLKGRPPHTIDGQHYHGWPESVTQGLRLIEGDDPVGATEFFAIGLVDANTGGDWKKTKVSRNVYWRNYAAGTCAIEIRRADPKGLDLSLPVEHEIIAKIINGLQGWVWTAPGTRSVEVLTNPIWISVNCMLRSRGLRYSSAATCEQYFDVTAAIAAAAICDTSVAKIIGSGNETQFKYRGSIQEEKPLRDWISEILMNCLGTYHFNFGKMTFKIRSNSSVEEAFTSGNIIFESLRIQPIKPSFNHLTAIFADREFEFAGNNLSVQDIGHAELIGGSSSPQFLKSNVNLSGTCNKSQAARIVTTRLREELGGITAAQWKAARRLQFKTTVLALAVEPGMVCSMTHDDMPGGGPGEFRVTAWRLNPDFSIDIEGRTTVDEMYDLTVGPKPVDVLAPPVPVELVYPPTGLVWGPDKVAPLSGDPMFAINDKTFKLERSYNAEFNRLEFIVTGKLPINSFDGDANRPIVHGYDTATTGGAVKGGKSYFISICARASTQSLTPPSNMLSLEVPTGTDTNVITLYNIEWPAGSYLGYVVFVGTDDGRMLTKYNSVTGSLPSTIAINTAPARSSWSMPSPIFDRLRVKIKRLSRIGAAQYEATTVTSSTIVCTDAISSFDWDGRDITVIAAVADEIKYLNFNCTAYNPATGEFTLASNPQAAGVVAGDLVVVRLQPSTTQPDNQISDSQLGLTIDAEIGNIVRIISGTGRGQVRRIYDNSATNIYISPNWTTNPDETSRFIIERPGWDFFAETNSALNAGYDNEARIATPVTAILDTYFLVQVVRVDTGGKETPDELAPIRELYIDPDSLAYRRAEYLHYILTTGGGALVESFENENVLDFWEAYNPGSYDGTPSRIAGGQAGNYVYHSLGCTSRRFFDNIPYNPNWLYRIAMSARWTVQTDASAQQLIFGLHGLDSDLADLGLRSRTVDMSGWTQNIWNEVVAWFSGIGAAAGTGVDPENARTLPADTIYFRPHFTINNDDHLGTNTNQSEIDIIEVTAFDADGQVRLYQAISSTGTINPGKVVRGSASIAAIIEQRYDNFERQGRLSEDWEDGSTVYTDEWTKNSGNGSISIVASGGTRGNSVLQVENGYSNLYTQRFFPFKPEALYRAEMKIKATSLPDDSNPYTYCSLRIHCYDSAKSYLNAVVVDWIYLTGEVGNWAILNGYFKGFGTSGTGTPEDPKGVPSGTVYFRPVLYFLYNDSHGNDLILDYIDIDIIDDDSVGIATKDWSITCPFSVADLNTVAWDAGTLKIGATSYSIAAGNTGDMTGKRYIYFDPAASPTALQVTATQANAVGKDKKLIGVAENGTDEATFDILDGSARNFHGSQVVVDSITSNEINAGSIQSEHIDVDVIEADMIKVGEIIHTHLDPDVLADAGDPSAWHYSGLTRDDTWYELSLSSIVPSGYRKVLFMLYILDSSSQPHDERFSYAREYGNSNNYNSARYRLGRYASGGFPEGWVAMSSTRSIEYKLDSGLTGASGLVRMWIP